MKVTLSVSLLSLSLFAAGAAQAAPPRYRIDYLPSLGGSSTATSINDLGWVAGRSTLIIPGEPSRRHAVLWRGQEITDLGTLGSPERQSAVVWPVKNVRGIVAGIAETDVIDAESEGWSCSAFLLGRPAGSPRYQCLGFVWEDGQMLALPTFGGTHGFAAGANNFGQVVGWAETTVRDPVGCTAPQKFQFRAALWEPRRNSTKELPPVIASGDTVSAATAINDRGQVVGISGICDDAIGKFSAIRAVLWENGRPKVLGDIGGEAWNTPMAINPQGDVVGFGNQSITEGGAPDWGAFLWTRHGGMRALPKLAGHLNAQANGLNLWRHAVGRSCADPSMSACDAVLWRDGGVHRLRDLIAEFPADGPRLTTAIDIDDFGRISGQAIDPLTGAGMAYVATPVY